MVVAKWSAIKMGQLTWGVCRSIAYTLQNYRVMVLPRICLSIMFVVPNVIIGTWMLKKLIKDAKTPEQWWVAVGSYNLDANKEEQRGLQPPLSVMGVEKNLRRLQMSSAPIFDAKVDNTKTAEVNHGNTN